ncbi:uncharacterized protein LOC134062349 [Sardina pilchardus]|uniref:uncharacterized protein LOC134062349 n=1 Tax=Sardina pilchardus TaxID=27697 RepID=UPI002E130BFC
MDGAHENVFPISGRTGHSVLGSQAVHKAERKSSEAWLPAEERQGSEDQPEDSVGKVSGCTGMRRKSRTGKRAEAGTSEKTVDERTLDPSSSGQLADKDFIISVLLSLSQEQFQSLWDDMANNVPVSKLAWTLSSWVKRSAWQVLPQAMMEVKTICATLPVSMGTSLESSSPARLRLNHQALQAQAPDVSSSASKCLPDQPEVFNKDECCHSSSAALTDGHRKSMGDSCCSLPICATPLDSPTKLCRLNIAVLSNADVSEHLLTTSGELSNALCSVSFGHSSEGINLGMTPRSHIGHKSQEVCYPGATAKMSSCTYTGGLVSGSLQPDISSTECLSVDNGSWCVSNMPSAVDALKNTMERMVLCVDNTRASQERLETLFTSGLLQPFIQDLVDQLREVISFGKTSAPSHIERSTSDPAISLSGWANKSQKGLATDRTLEITRVYIQKVVRTLLRELLIALHAPWAENEKGACSSRTYQRPSEKVCAEVVKVFTEALVRQVMTLLPNRQATCLHPSPSKASLQSHSRLASDITQICHVPSPCTSSLNFQGEDYRCLVTILVVKLLLNIHQTEEYDHIVSIPNVSQMLANRVLFEFCAMSGLSRSEPYPPTLAIQKVYRDVYRKLLAEFGTKGELQRALFAQRVSFSKSLVNLLCEELLKHCRKEKVENLSNSNKRVMSAANPPKTTLEKDRKIATKVSSFFKERRSSKKFFRSTNQVTPRGGGAHQISRASVDHSNGGPSSLAVPLGEEIIAGHGHMMEDVHIDNSGSGDRPLILDENSPSVFSRVFDRFSTVLDRSL